MLVRVLVRGSVQSLAGPECACSCACACAFACDCACACAWLSVILSWSRVCLELEACCLTAFSITDRPSSNRGSANPHTQIFYTAKISKRTVLKPIQILCLRPWPKNHIYGYEILQCVYPKNCDRYVCWCIIADVFGCVKI